MACSPFTQGPKIGDRRSRVDIDRGARQHAELAHPPKSRYAQRRQSHDQIDHKERNGRDYPQGKEVERPIPFERPVKGFEALAKLALDRVSQDVPAQKKSQDRTVETISGEKNNSW